MYKTTNRFISAAAIAITVLQFTISSCKSELTYVNPDSGTSKTPVSFSGNVITTRVNGSNWEDKDPIGIFMIKTGETLSTLSIADSANNKKYIFSQSNQAIVPATSKDTIYYPAKDKVDFIAYYPYTTRISSFSIPVNVSNQSVQANVDLLYSNNLKNIGLTTESQKLSFEHKLTKLKLVLTRGTGITAEQMQGAIVTIENIPVKGILSLAAGELSVDNTSSTTLTLKTTTSGESAEAIILPGSSLNKTICLTTRSGVKRVYTVKEENWAAKTEYQYTLSVERQIVPTVLEAEITPWTDGGNVTMNQNDKEENANTWDGASYDTSWYNAEGTSFTLHTAAELAGFAHLVNINLITFKNKTINLQANINLGNYNWIPIASASTSSIFEGTFDGNYHTIFGLTFSEQSSDIGIGLFTQNNGIIKNLTVDGNFTVNYTGTKTSAIYGGIAGINTGSIIRCKNYIKINSGETDKAFTMLAIGGICGRNTGGSSMLDCQNYGTINYTTTKMVKGSPLYVGGITAFNQGNTTGCDNNSLISVTGGRTQVGGIAGFCGGGSNIENCTNSGSIQGTTNVDSCFVGGIAGSASTTTGSCLIKSSSNSAAITATGPAFAGIGGGIIGYMKSGTLVGSSAHLMHATVSANSFSGGIAGYFIEKANNAVYLDCDNNGLPLKWIGNNIGKNYNSGAVNESN